jgi:hypothetical protein
VTQRSAFGYTHYPPTQHNIDVVNAMTHTTINFSADGVAQAIARSNLGIDQVCVVPSDFNSRTIDLFGVDSLPIRICPATRGPVSCSGGKLRDGTMTTACGGTDGPLCARSGRTFVVGFPAHGSGKSKLDKQLRGIE